MMRAGRRKIDNRGRVEKSGLGPADFLVSGAKSRAAARMLAEQARREAETRQNAGDSVYGAKGKFVITKERLSYGGMVVHARWVPGAES